MTSPRGPVSSPPPGEPGWWPAADGQWYPPETSPSAQQQTQYAPPTQYAAPNPWGHPQGYAPVNYGYGGQAFPGQKSRVVAGILQLCLAGFGIGRFYLGYTGIGVAQLLVTIFTCGFGAIWGMIDGIMILTGSVQTDADGRPLS